MAQDPDRSELALFDADAYLEALRRPALKLGGRLYTGRLLSFEEWGRFQQRFQPGAAGVKGDVVVDPRRFQRLLRDVVTAVFGRGRPWWAVWRPTIADRLRQEPLAVQVEALKSFSRSQTEAFAADAARMATPNGTTVASETS